VWEPINIEKRVGFVNAIVEIKLLYRVAPCEMAEPKVAVVCKKSWRPNDFQLTTNQKREYIVFGKV
jgi:hypothetical protein